MLAVFAKSYLADDSGFCRFKGLTILVDISQYLREHRQIESEKDVSQKLIESLAKHFNIFKEVDGKHYTGKNVRIDAILKPKDASGWADKNVAIGLEIKRGDDTVGEVTKHLSQSVDYANSRFNGFGYLYIFCYPDPNEGTWGQHTTFFDRFMGQLGVGFLRASGGLSLRLKGHLVWSEQSGPYEAKRWSLERKFGSK